MKKRYLLILLVALLCLTGCECKHEWTEADCLVPKTCANCGITDGEALGHTFDPATCEAPETCIRCGGVQGEKLEHQWKDAVCEVPQTCALCGMTQGEAPGHTMGKWTVSGETMSRLCKVCNYAEEQPIDREAYVWDHIVGHWDPYIIYMGGEGYWATALGNQSVGFCIRITEEGALTLVDGDTVREGTVSFKEYKDDYYFVDLTIEGEEEPWVAILDDSTGEVLLCMISIFFSQHEQICSYAQGLWATADGGVVRSLTLHEDGTFDYNGEITGQWHVRPAVVDEYNSRISKVLLSYAQDGEEKTDYLELHLGDGNMPLEEYLHYGTAYGYAYLGSEYYSMSKTEPEQLVKLEAALTAGQEKLLGTWNSQTAGKYIYDDSKSYDWIQEGYSLEFREDGTFTAQLDKEKTGTWRFTEVINGSNYMYYHYELEYEDAGDVIDLSISLSESGTLDYTEFYEGRNEHYSFRPGSDPAAEEGRNMLCRQWASRYARTYMQDTETDDYWEETGYSLQFREDCTFSGTMEEPISGIWVFTDSQDQTYPDGKTVTLYMYTMQVEGEQECMHLIYDGDSLTASFYDGKCNYTWAFSPITE